MKSVSPLELTKQETKAMNQAIEALRKATVEQVFGSFTVGVDTGCAMFVVRNRRCTLVERRYPTRMPHLKKGHLFYMTWGGRIMCPHHRDGCRSLYHTLGDLVVHLNDQHHMSFNQIADWLESWAAAPEKHFREEGEDHGTD